MLLASPLSGTRTEQRLSCRRVVANPVTRLNRASIGASARQRGNSRIEDIKSNLLEYLADDDDEGALDEDSRGPSTATAGTASVSTTTYEARTPAELNL